MAQAEREQLTVVMFPWLAHGHITPYLELARRLTSTDHGDLSVTVHLVSTPVNLSAIARHETPRIRFVSLHLPPDDLPPELHTTKHLPARLMPALKRACDLAAPRFGALLDALRPRPDILLYDFLYPWAPLEAAARGVPAAHLSTCSAAATAFFVHCLGGNSRAGRAFPFQGVGLGSAEEEAKYTALFAVPDHPDALIPDRDRLLLSLARSEAFVAVKTCADVERAYMGYLSELLGGKEIVPVGPLLVDDSDSGAGGGGKSSEEADRITRWLDAQPPASVVLVSVGSEYFMSEQQLAAMARGLELSGERFLWVVRFPKGAAADADDDNDTARALPDGFAPAPERGLVVEGWLPQRRVLAHPACGAFLSHCGWSSVLEALAAGVPVVALPLHIDQPLGGNVAAELGAAVRVPQERFGEFRAEDVARAVRGAVRGEESRALRARAAELAEVVKRSDADGEQVGALVRRMARLCGKGQRRVAVPN